MRHLSLIAALALGACFAPTSAVIVGTGTGSAVTCQVSIGWSSRDLSENCGTPAETYPWHGHEGGECWYYTTSFSPNGLGDGPRGYLVCLRAPSSSETKRTVDVVVPLSAH